MILDFIKKVIFFLWNPEKFQIRDSSVKIIDDWRRKKHSKEVQKKIDNGEIQLPKKEGDGPRCYRIESKGKVVLVKQGQK